MKIKQCHRNRIFPTSNGQVVERDTYSILLSQKRPDNTTSKSRNRTKAEIEQRQVNHPTNIFPIKKVPFFSEYFTQR